MAVIAVFRSHRWQCNGVGQKAEFGGTCNGFGMRLDSIWNMSEGQHF
jgi:hypothetical protein